MCTSYVFSRDLPKPRAMRGCNNDYLYGCVSLLLQGEEKPVQGNRMSEVWHNRRSGAYGVEVKTGKSLAWCSLDGIRWF